MFGGGIHPTVRPEESLDYCDFVIMGESEESFLEFLRAKDAGSDYSKIENLCFKNKKGEVVINPLKPLIQDLDTLPFPDYDLKDQYILYEGKLRRATNEIMKKTLPVYETMNRKYEVAYKTMTTRGCPHNCAYCCNSSIKRLYPNQRHLRRRSVKNIMDELVQMKKKFPFIKIISFADDTFTSADNNYFKSFAKEYKKRVGLPFRCLTSPLTINEEKMGYLVDAGMYFIGMGIESGSERMLRCYKRHIPLKGVLGATKIINKFKHKMLPPLYDILLDSPYETEEDKLETLKLIAELPKPYSLALYSLVLFPGTDLYMQAKKDGLIKDEKREIYRKLYDAPKGTYINLLFKLCKDGKLSKRKLKFLSNKRMVKIFSKSYFGKVLPLLSRAISEGRNIKKGLNLVYHGDFDRLREYYRRWKGG